MGEKEQELTIKNIQKRIAILFRVLLVVAVFYELFEKRWVLMFATAIILFLTYLPEIFEKRYKIDIPTELEVMIVIFIYASLFLGELRGYYTKFWWWDIVLHTSSGVVIGFAGFLIMFVLHKKNKIKSSPFLISMFVFCFSLAIGAVWEIFEFGMDSCFGFNMQNSLRDTMWDLIVDSVGAFVVSIFCYFYLKGKNFRFVNRIIRTFIRNNPQLASRN